MLTKEFKNLSRHDAAIAGGKGASLGEMTQAGIPVPPGFVVLADAFEKFIEEQEITADIDAILHKVKHQDTASIDRASEEIKAIILGTKMPKDIATEIKKEFKKLGAKFVAVRSSATAEDSSAAAWAGQLDSFLNTDEKKLLDNVRRCWASLFTPRAIFYRFEKGLHQTKISVAVVVQKMVQSEISGIAFSVHPVTEDRNQLIIEASYGLGEAIVSGQVTPDSYVIEKHPRQIIERIVQSKTRGLYRLKNENEWQNIPKAKADKQALSDTQILKLSELILHIEKHYGFPCDIEWAFEKGKFYIVQSRPITTLTEERPVQSKQIVLSKIYSREKSFFYLCMWNDSDRLGYKRYLGHDVRNNLFIREGDTNWGSIWYSLEEFAQINRVTEGLLNKDNKLITSLINTVKMELKIITPYLHGKVVIKNLKDLGYYYHHIVEFWSAMNVLFNIPDLEKAPKKSRELALHYRKNTEKYSYTMDKLFIDFWQKKFPKYSDITYVLSISEILNFKEGQAISKYRKRLNGFGMFNEVIYLADKLPAVLEKNNLILEKEPEVLDGNILKGRSAYRGRAVGRVHILRTNADIATLQKGDVLVANMTNPDHVQAMKKAVAIVTNEGGATCHAAIISRELKVPCIVGTQFATKLLKDGDMVEVDAERGIIKKI